MSHLRRICVLLALLAITILAPAATPTAESPTDGNPKLRDAMVYASDWSIDVEEAMRRLDLQDLAGELEVALRAGESETFAGLWIQHTPDFRIIVQFTHDGAEEIGRYVDGGPLSGIVEVRGAELSIAELEAAQQGAEHMATEVGIPVNSSINVFENRVELYVTDQAQLEAALSNAKAQLPEPVHAVIVPRLATLATDIYGGLALTTCTSGFSVQHSGGTRGITTAGHCQNDQWYGGVQLTYQYGLYSNQWDAQWHTTPGFTPRNLIWDGTYNRYIYSTKHRDDQAVGEFVCKYGMTTGYGCGYIQSKTYCPGAGLASTFIYVHRDGVDLAEPGDSGGPWFYNNTAYGQMTHQNDQDAIYMAVNYLSSGLGLTVLTQ